MKNTAIAASAFHTPSLSTIRPVCSVNNPPGLYQRYPYPPTPKIAVLGRGVPSQH
jgi:hypothetical protein